jgi:hypothetical protein
MKIIDIAGAELMFNIWKLGFYYCPYSGTEWIRLRNCFTWKKAKSMVVKNQILAGLNDLLECLED